VTAAPDPVTAPAERGAASVRGPTEKEMHACSRAEYEYGKQWKAEIFTALDRGTPFRRTSQKDFSTFQAWRNRKGGGFTGIRRVTSAAISAFRDLLLQIAHRA
jgi:hypothetical protein